MSQGASGSGTRRWSEKLTLGRSSREKQTLANLRSALPDVSADAATGERETPRTPLPRPPETPREVIRPLPRRADRATLTMLNGPAVGAMFSLPRGSMVLGRGTQVDITVDEESVSRRHACIFVDAGGRYLVEDLASTNGTFVGGRPVKRAPLRDGDRVQLGRSCSFRFDVVDEAEETLQRNLYEASMRDDLTGLANRRYLFERVALAIDRASEGSDVAVVMLDVDHFKAVNDRFGHATGDEVLRAIARGLLPMLAEDDVFARYGGEEFVVLVCNGDPEHALTLANELRRAVGGLRIDVCGGAISVTASAGVVSLSECEIADGLELFARADARMYAAKAAGRNRVCSEG